MNAPTPAEMYLDLIQHCDDEDFIERTMRAFYPDWVKPNRHSVHNARIAELQEKRAKARRRLIEQEAELKALRKREQAHTENKWMKDVETASRELLKALHREHPGVMRYIASKGRQVVWP